MRPQRKTQEMIGLAEENVELVPTVADKTEEKIENLIHYIRGEQVMLDSDLAMLYNVETKRLNENVKRNSKRFSENFCFQLGNQLWKCYTAGAIGGAAIGAYTPV